MGTLSRVAPTTVVFPLHYPTVTDKPLSETDPLKPTRSWAQKQSTTLIAAHSVDRRSYVRGLPEGKRPNSLLYGCCVVAAAGYADIAKDREIHDGRLFARRHSSLSSSTSHRCGQ
jgi:hypothetical protein